jgi:hypothetical protein
MHLLLEGCFEFAVGFNEAFSRNTKKPPNIVLNHTSSIVDSSSSSLKMRPAVSRGTQDRILKAQKLRLLNECDK